MDKSLSRMDDVRPSPIAGRWYPAEANALRQTVDAYLEAAATRCPEERPHAYIDAMRALSAASLALLLAAACAQPAAGPKPNPTAAPSAAPAPNATDPNALQPFFGSYRADDGRVFVIPVSHSYRIRTGEQDAL